MNSSYRCRLFGWLAAVVTCAFPQQPEQDEQIFEIDSAVLQIVETVEVPATASGPLRAVNVTQGSIIAADQVLASIVDDDARFRLEEAEIDLEIIHAQTESRVDIEFAEKSRQVAEVDFRRAEESNRAYAGVVSDREMDRLELLVQKSEAELEKIQFEKTIMLMQKRLKQVTVKQHRVELTRHEIKSGVSGQIVEINKRRGEWVNVADPVFKIVRLDRLRVEEYLPATVATSSLVGAPATIDSSQMGDSEAGNQPGQVVFVSPNIDPLNSMVMVWIEFQNPQLKLRPGMKGQVKIAITESDSNSDEPSTVKQ